MFLCFCFWAITGDISPAPGAGGGIPVEVITLLRAGLTYILENNVLTVNTVASKALNLYVEIFSVKRKEGKNMNGYDSKHPIMDF